MKRARTIAIAGGVLLIVLMGGYYGYTYLKEKPPEFLIKLVTTTKAPTPLPAGDVAPLTVPEGFIATIFSREVPGARVMIRDPKGTMLVSETGDKSNGKVVALPDANGDSKADSVVTVLSGLGRPHGLAVLCATATACSLYVAETGSLKSYDYDMETMTATHPKELATFPSGSGHYTRTLLPSKDGKSLFISIGSSCNVCDEADQRRATIQTFDIASGSMKTFAKGLRNSVFMALHPTTGELWATDNGRDLIGDDIPPDDVNIVKQGADYGWPTCYGQNIHDTDFDKKQYFRDPCADKTPPHIALQAHSAALGLAFVPKDGWPSAWGNDLLIAFHGSWNRSVPTGYKVVRVDLDAAGKQQGALQDFVTGFLPVGGKADDAIGRPVGILAEPDGVVYISDDRAGAIYRITLMQPTQ